MQAILRPLGAVLEQDREQLGRFFELLADRRFLAAARARGCQTQVGTDMLFEQIPAYLEFFGLPTTTAEELREVARISY